MSTTLTIRIDDKLDRALTRFAQRTGRPKSELAREALRRQLAMARFEEARRVVLPFAEARGLLTDEDVFAAVS
jgi:predicted transcriptional regulator